jgi:ornithine--oxo-acid transaminase
VIVLCSFISPYRERRAKTRREIEEVGTFVEVYVECPLEVCAERDVKGLYAKAFAGEIQNFTGVSDPYEPPENPEIVCHTAEETVEESAAKVIRYLEDHGLIPKVERLAPEVYVEIEETYGAHNYAPLDVIVTRAEGVWVWDVEGRRYIDFLSAYSALNQGHVHPRILRALVDQARRVTLTSRAFRNDQLPLLEKELCELTGFEMMLPMNSGAEAVETALKAARKWGYTVKGVPPDRAQIITCAGNFHGRTITVISFSTEEQYREGFGPFTPGFVTIPYGDADALEAAITPETVAFLVEPIQGEGGIIIPPEGYLRRVREICDRHNVLFIADEIQTGLGRTGRLLACDWEGVKPDVVTLGKALSGGFYPVSAVLASRDVLGVFRPGDHGSTFGGNPLACAVAREALRVLVEEGLIERAEEMGAYLLGRLRRIESPYVREIRGKGLLIGVELTPEAGGARRFCEALKDKGVLCKDTHDTVIRFAPPLVITREEIDWAVERVEAVLTE